EAGHAIHTSGSISPGEVKLIRNVVAHRDMELCRNARMTDECDPKMPRSAFAQQRIRRQGNSAPFADVDDARVDHVAVKQNLASTAPTVTNFWPSAFVATIT